MLRLEINTPKAGEEVLAAAVLQLRLEVYELRADYEHGHWWVTHRRTGTRWSAEDVKGAGTESGFFFEQVTMGEDG